MKQTDKEKLISSFQQLLQEQEVGSSDSKETLEQLLDASENYLPAYEPNVDAGFARFSKRIATEQPAAKVVEMQPRRSWLSIAAAVALLVGALAAFQFIYNPSNTALLTATTSEHQLETIELVDGTIVRLNENSTLSYPTEFSADTRLVQLEGEAYFDVTKNPAQPFVIQTSETTVRVLGTSFNVRAKAEEDFTEVVVETGKVQVMDAEETRKVILQPFEAAVHQHGAKLEKVTDNDLTALAWHSLDFRKVALQEVISAMENHYQINIDTKEAAVIDCLQTINFAEADVDTALEILKTSLNVIITQTTEDQYIMRGGNCATAQ